MKLQILMILLFVISCTGCTSLHSNENTEQNNNNTENDNQETITYSPLLSITNYSHNWTREYHIIGVMWTGSVQMTVTNNGNLGTNISHAEITTYGNQVSSLKGKIFFDFKTPFTKVVDSSEGDLLLDELSVSGLSDDLLFIAPGETIVLNSIPSYAYMTYDPGETFFVPGDYDMNIWLFEQNNVKQISHTLFETTVSLI